MVDRIEQLCKQHNTNLTALEKELGFGKSTIKRWDLNKPSIEKVALVAKFFNVSLDYINEDTDNPNIVTVRGEDLGVDFDGMTLNEDLFENLSREQLQKIALLSLQLIEEKEKEDKNK